MFPKNSGFSPQIIHFNRVFHYFHPPFWGYPYFWKHPYPASLREPNAENMLNIKKKSFTSILRLIIFGGGRGYTFGEGGGRLTLTSRSSAFSISCCDPQDVSCASLRQMDTTGSFSLSWCRCCFGFPVACWC